jgi:hypothetical protein
MNPEAAWPGARRETRGPAAPACSGLLWAPGPPDGLLVMRSHASVTHLTRFRQEDAGEGNFVTEVALTGLYGVPVLGGL